MIATSKPIYKYFETKYTVIRDRDSDGGGGFHFLAIEDNSTSDTEGSTVPVFTSKDLKVVIPFHGSFFHLIFDTLGIILNEYKKNRELVFILDYLGDPYGKTDSLLEFATNVLETSGVKYKLVNLNNSSMTISRFYFIDNTNYGINKFISIKDYAVDHNLCYSGEPYRKVYLSRSKSFADHNRWKRPDLAPGSPFTDDYRIDNEEVLEEYFKDLGYEIIYGESFGDYKERLEYFSSIKTLISPTGAGLSHAIFMGAKSKIIELAIPMGAISPDANWSYILHDHYKSICLASRIPYIALSSMRSASDIIDTIENNSFVKDIIND